MEYQEILYNTLDGVATITINRPDTLNALTSLTQAEIKHALFISDTTEEVIGTVITGAGRGFCSGVDMKSLGKISDDGKRTQDAFKHLEVSFENENKNFLGSPAYFLALKKPLIAAINGACAGLGFSYATFCDMRFMDRTAKLVTSFSPRGLIAEHGTSWILPKIIGPSHALDLMWTSRRVDAEEAYRIGYANRLSENGEALKEAQDFIFNLAKYKDNPLLAKAKIIRRGIDQANVLSCSINIFLTAGSNNHAILEVLPATNIEKKAAINILFKYFLE